MFDLMSTRRRSSTPGHIRSRGPDTWQVMLESAPDPLTGARRRVVRTVHGSKADAERIRAELMLDVGKGRVEARGRSRLNDVIDRWLDHAGPDLAPKTLYNYHRIHDRYLRTGLGTRSIDHIGPVDLDDVYARLRSDGLSPKTIRNVHALLRRAFGQAVRWGWIRENPASLALPPRLKRPQIDPPSPEQVRTLLETARQGDPDLFTFLWLAATTGARRGELGALRWSDFSAERGELLVERSLVGVASELATKSTKSDRARRIALGRETIDVLVAHQRRHAPPAQGTDAQVDVWMFPGADGRPLHPDTWTQRFRRLCDRLEIRCRLHDLRHFVATQALAAGVPVRTVSGRLGHANPATTHNVYAHFVAASDRDAAATLDGLVTAVRPPAPEGRDLVGMPHRTARRTPNDHARRRPAGGRGGRRYTV